MGPQQNRKRGRLIEPLPVFDRPVGTLPEVAARFACSLRSVKGWVYAEGLPHFFTGGRVYVNFQEVDEWFAKRIRRVIPPQHDNHELERNPGADSRAPDTLSLGS